MAMVHNPNMGAYSLVINGELPEYRVTAAAYDAVEFTESMGPDGVVYSREGGYLELERHQNVLIWLGTATHGHGGNKFDEYVWGQTVRGAAGWLPVNFRMEFAGMGFIPPDQLVLAELPGPELAELMALAATGPLPEETAAIAATVLPSEESAALAATSPPPVAGTGFAYEFDC
jgi:hypothetical protein